MLQCVKDAVDKQLFALTKEHPNRRAMLITFSDEVLCSWLLIYMCFDQSLYAVQLQVTVIGDEKCDAVTVAGDKLSNSDVLIKLGTEIPVPGAIKLAYEDLQKKLFRYRLVHNE